MQIRLDLSHEAYLTDRITGELKLDANGEKQRFAQDEVSGDYYVKVCEVLPSDSDPRSKARRLELLALNPVQARNAQGYWVKLDGYSPYLTDADVAAAKAAAAK